MVSLRPASRLLGQLGPCDQAPLQRHLLRRAVHYRSAPRHPHRRREAVVYVQSILARLSLLEAKNC